jgi:hypothetical protein
MTKKLGNTTAKFLTETIAEKFSYEKRLIVKELEKSGVHSILTKPSLLFVNVINKYLEFKSKGLI